MQEDFKGMEAKVMAIQNKAIPSLTSSINMYHSESMHELAKINEVLPDLCKKVEMEH
jgi:hypothetical protein